MKLTHENVGWAYELKQCEQSFTYLAPRYLRFKSKHVIGFPTFKFNPVQEIIHSTVTEQWKRTGKIRQVWGKARQVGSCLAPSTLVLTADLTWKTLEDLHVGERVISVDEFGENRRGVGRRLRTAIVEVKSEVYKPAFKLIMSNGLELIATAEHRFLSQRGYHKKSTVTCWRAVSDMNKPYLCWSGQHAIRFLVEPWSEPDYEDGWMAGIIDGEGYFRFKRSGAQINISQVSGPVFDRICKYMRDKKYNAKYSIDDRTPGKTSKLGKQNVNRVNVYGMAEVLKLLGQTRPSRFSWAGEWWNGKALPCNSSDNSEAWPYVKEIIPLGPQRMLDIQTSTGTFIANGFVSHNSTYWRAFSFHRTAFRDHINALVVAHDEPDALELFQLDKGFYDALPAPLQPSLKYSSKIKMDFGNRNSKILVNHARNMHVGASQMNHIVHLTEVARYPNASEIQASLFPSISDAKGDNCSAVVLESTSRFGGEWFKAFADAAIRHENEYEFHFVPWFVHPDYHRPVPQGFEPNLEERDLLKKYPALTWDNLVWYRLKRAEYVTTPALFIQDFPFSWEESWVLPQGTLRTFADEITMYMDAMLRPGVRHDVSSVGLWENIGGPIEVWETPKEGVYYDIGIDVAGGATEGADWTVIEVIRRDTLAQVAEARFHMDPASDEFLSLVYWLGRCYNSGQMVPDITGGWGHALLTDLQKRGYPNIWQWRRRDDAKEKVSSRLGFYYTKRDKTWLVHNAVKTVQRDKPRLHSSHLLSEMRGFLTLALDEWGAAPGLHDDAINAYMLALLGATDERPREMTELPPDPVMPSASKPWAYHDVEEELDSGEPNKLGSYIDRVLSSQ